MVWFIFVIGFNFIMYCIMVIYEMIKYSSVLLNLFYSFKGFFDLIIFIVFD